MKIAVLGTGNVGGVLGTRWAQKGHRVVFGSRAPAGDRVRSLLQNAGNGAKALGINEAAQSSDVVLLATPWSEAERVVRGAGDLRGKILIDCTNPLSSDLKRLELGHDTSASERIAAWAANARVVKAFNTVSAAVMANPIIGGQKATLFFCGDDEDAKLAVQQLAEDLEFEAVDAGPLEMARYLEPLAMLYIRLAIAGWGSSCAFKIIRRSS